jgi:hypothetical protein
MIDDFARPAWVDNHETFAANVAAGLARLARWVRAKANDETPAVTLHRGKGLRSKPRTPVS